MLKAKCRSCQHCLSYRKNLKTRAEYSCTHPDQEFISKYFREHRMVKMPGFLGFAKPNEFPVKTAPKWCPINNTKYYQTTLEVYEPDLKGEYNTEPHTYMFVGPERMTDTQFQSLLWECVEIERFAEGVELLVEVKTEYDGEYVDSDTYEVSLTKVIHTTELSPMIDWEKCSPELPKIYAIDKELSKMEVNIQ